MQQKINSNGVPTKNTLPTETAPTTPEAVDYTASFEIYTHGTKRVFTNAMYHNLSEEVYLTAVDPSIVHIKAARTTWNDLFETLPMTLTKDCLITGTGQRFCDGEDGDLQFFINGTENANALKTEIAKGDSLQVVYQ